MMMVRVAVTGAGAGCAGVVTVASLPPQAVSTRAAASGAIFKTGNFTDCLLRWGRGKDANCTILQFLHDRRMTVRWQKNFVTKLAGRPLAWPQAIIPRQSRLQASFLSRQDFFHERRHRGLFPH